jgi:S-adenosylmethionine decarboxylase
MKIRELHIDAYGCKCDLDNSKLLLSTFVQAVKSINAKIVKKVVYHYKPCGLTIVLLLAESHASLFTWPEVNYAAVDIFLCNEKMDPYKCWKIIKEILKPKKIKIKEILREVKQLQ